MEEYNPTPQTRFFIDYLKNYVPPSISELLHAEQRFTFPSKTRLILNHQISILLNQPININLDDTHSMELIFISNSFISKINLDLMEEILNNLTALCCETAEKLNFIRFVHNHFESIGKHIDIITSKNYIMVQRLIVITKFILDTNGSLKYTNLLNVSPIIISIFYKYVNDIKLHDKIIDIISDIAFISTTTPIKDININCSILFLPDPLHIDYHNTIIYDNGDDKYIPQLFHRIILLSRDVFSRILSSKILTLDDATILSRILSGGNFLRGTFCIMLATLANNPKYAREIAQFFQKLSTKTGVELLRQIFETNSSPSFLILVQSCGNIFSQIFSRYARQLNPWMVKSAKVFSSSNQWIDILGTPIAGDYLAQKMHGLFCALFRINEMKATDKSLIIIQNFDKCFDRMDDLEKLIRDKHVLQDKMLSDLLASLLTQKIEFITNLTKDQNTLRLAGDRIYEFILSILHFTRVVLSKDEKISELQIFLNCFIKSQTQWISSFVENEDREIHYVDIASIAVFIRSIDVNCWARIFRYCIISDNRSTLQLAYNLLITRTNTKYIEKALSLFFDFSVDGTLSRRSQNIRNIAKLFAILTAASVSPRILESICQNNFISPIIYSISAAFDTYIAQNTEFVPLLSTVAVFLETLISDNNSDVVLGIPLPALISIIPYAHPIIADTIFRLEKIYRNVSHTQHDVQIEFNEPQSWSFISSFNKMAGLETTGRKILSLLLDIIFGGKVYFATVIPL